MQQPRARPDEATIITVDVTRVNLLFTVTDSKGRFVTDLTKDDFEVIESKKPQVIQEFTAESDLPLRLGILIDTSNSIRDRFKFEQEAAISFINNVIRTNHGQGHGGQLRYQSRARGRSDRRYREARQRRSAICGPAAAPRFTMPSIFACRDKLSQDQPSTSSAARSSSSAMATTTRASYTRDQALEMAQKADVVLYAISTNRSKIEQDGDKVLKYYTAETGGRAFFPFQVEDMEQSFENIANELRHQYNISYRPEPLKTDGSSIRRPARERTQGSGRACPQRLLRSEECSALGRLSVVRRRHAPVAQTGARDQQAIQQAEQTGGRPRRPAANQRLAWWREARFGCFIHWGVYSGPGGEWNGKPFKGYAEHLMRIQKIPLAEYKAESGRAVQSHEVQCRGVGEAHQGRRDGLPHHHRQAPRRLRDVAQQGLDATTSTTPPNLRAIPCASWPTPAAATASASASTTRTPSTGRTPTRPATIGTTIIPAATASCTATPQWYDLHPDLLEKARRYVDRKAIPQVRELIAMYHPDILWFDTPQKLPVS